jgi:hypothetical protein
MRDWQIAAGYSGDSMEAILFVTFLYRKVTKRIAIFKGSA